MKSLAIAFAMVAAANSFAGVIYSNTADLSTGTRNFKLDSAEYKLIPTKTEIREIPGCIPGGEAGTICTEEVVLESQPVVHVNISYFDPFLQSDGYDKSWIGFNFRTEDISAEDLAALKSVYPTWRHPFSKVGARVAKKNFSLDVKRSERTIQVVDVRNSRLCPVNGETGEPAPGCQEVIVYKPAKTWVNEITVLKN
jgi:hypothetical protein